VLHFLDIGAYNGKVSAVFLARDPSMSHHAYLFEPNPVMMAQAKERVKDPRATFYEAAVSGTDCFGRLYVPKPTSEGSSLYLEKGTSRADRYIEVEVINLVRFIRDLPPGPVVLYANCEGSEFDFVPRILDSDVRDRVTIWSVSFHHIKKGLEFKQQAYDWIVAKMAEYGIENHGGHMAKPTDRASLKDLMDVVMKLRE
jgi:FkbM family methyltransferase